MNMRSVFNAILTGIFILLLVSILASQLFGFPPPISYVETNSMEPQLEPGDGFIGVPKPVAGDISEGDVVTYRAQEIQGGGLTTHRIVDQTEEGYITKGDNNPFTDQEGDEPPVPESQIVLVAVQINGQIIKIPFVGQAATFVEGGISSAIGLLGLNNISATNPGVVVGLVGIVLIVGNEIYALITDSETRSVSRSVSRSGVIDSRLVLLAILLIVSLPLLSMTTLPGGTDEMRIVSSTTANPDDRSVIQAGTYDESSMRIENSQPVPMVIIVEGATDDLQIADQVLTAAAGESVETEYRMWVPEETGSYLRVRSVSFYFHVLPASVIGFLHDIHPLVALVTTTGVIVSPVALLFYLTVGFRPIPLRETTR